MSKGVYVTIVAATAGVLTSAYCVYYLYKDGQKPKIPTIWKEVGTLKDIIFYPIKSCGPLQRKKAECTFLGVKDGWLQDRMLLVIDDNDNFVTARVTPKLLLVHSTIDNSVLTLTCKDMEPINVDLEEVIVYKKLIKATLWGGKVLVYDCGWEVSEWFSRLLSNSQKIYRLGLYASTPQRFYAHYFNKMCTMSQAGIFSDEAPFNLINEASMDDLKKRLNDDKITVKNFRTNFILTGAQAYEEDNWKFVKIGENIFEIIKFCTRCVLTTLDPNTGTRNPNMDPLTTLKKYRQNTDPEMRKSSGNSPRMGLQMKLRSGQGGIVSINDPIYVA